MKQHLTFYSNETESLIFTEKNWI